MVTISHSRSELDQSKSSGREQVFRKSTSIHDHPAQGDLSTTAFLAESRTGLNRLTRLRMTVKPETIFRQSQGIASVVITLNQELLCVSKSRCHSQYHFKTESIHTSQRALKNEKTPEIHKRDPEKTYCPGRVDGMAY